MSLKMESARVAKRIKIEDSSDSDYVPDGIQNRKVKKSRSVSPYEVIIKSSTPPPVLHSSDLLMTIDDDEEPESTHSTDREEVAPRRSCIPDADVVKKGKMSKHKVARKQYTVGRNALQSNDFEGAMELVDFAVKNWEENRTQVLSLKRSKIEGNSEKRKMINEYKTLMEDVKEYKKELESQRDQIATLNEQLEEQSTRPSDDLREWRHLAEMEHEVRLSEAQKELETRDIRIQELEASLTTSSQQFAFVERQKMEAETLLIEIKSLKTEADEVARNLRQDVVALTQEVTQLTDKMKKQKKDFKIEKEGLILTIKSLKGDSESDADDE